MIGQYRITANLMEVDEDKKALHMGVKIEGMGNEAIIHLFEPEIFTNMMKAMKNTNEKAYIEALHNIATEAMDDAAERIKRILTDD